MSTESNQKAPPKPPIGSPCWIEIMSSEPTKLKEFYAALFPAWKFTEPEAGMPENVQYMFEQPDRLGGAILSLPEGCAKAREQNLGVGSTVYYLVDTIEEIEQDIAKLGGTQVVKKTTVPGHGWFANFKDPEGTRFGCFETDWSVFCKNEHSIDSLYQYRSSWTVVGRHKELRTMVSAFSPQYVNGIYIPSALLLIGVAIIKRDLLPYAIAFAALVGGWKFYSSGTRKVLKPTDFQEFELEEKTVLSHNTAIYRFKLPRKTDILGLPIGQHISLAATIAGQPKEVVRSYTPVSSDEDKGHFDLLIKSYPTGNISKHVAGLQVGQTMKVRGPKGAMVYTPNMVRHFGMIAGGTGITPMLQVVKAIIRGRAAGDKTEVDLIFANVNPEDILLKDDLDALVAKDPKFRVHYVLNNPPEKWSGGTGFVTADLIKEKLPAPASDVKILVCGPPPMVAAMKKATESLGYAKARPVSKLEDQVFCF
ncbi:Nn.00g004260.m01.CDS01 [Neocucurbitaria sp. VM-36]